MRSRRGFTLTEILIVIALIILIIGLAVPAFSFITGSRSVDAGENIVSAMLSRGRAEALRTKRTAGVAFFRDLRTERSAMALIVSAADRDNVSEEAAGLEEYKGWQEKGEDGTTPVEYRAGDVVCILLPDSDLNNKKTTQLFVCIQRHLASQANKPPNASYWGSVNATEIDSMIGVEYQFLPAGIGAQTINDPNPTNAGTVHDRYLRSGMILFDGSGNLLHRAYTIKHPTDADETHLFRLMGFDQRAGGLQTTDVGTSAAFPLYSQMGVVLYDEQQFRTAGGSQDDPTNDNLNMSPNEQGEEQWLDANSLSLMVNRYNGTLVRGE